jgi:hypothetical protein
MNRRSGLLENLLRRKLNSALIEEFSHLPSGGAGGTPDGSAGGDCD